jgi:hypothetical protein
LTVRRVLDGVSRNVLHVYSSLLCPKPDKLDSETENAEQMSGSECRVACRESQNPTSDPTSNPTANIEGNGQNVGFVGSETGRDTPIRENNAETPIPAGPSGGAWIAPDVDPAALDNPFIPERREPGMEG